MPQLTYEMKNLLCHSALVQVHDQISKMNHALIPNLVYTPRIHYYFVVFFFLFMLEFVLAQGLNHPDDCFFSDACYHLNDYLK